MKKVLLSNHGHILTYNIALALNKKKILKRFISSHYKGKNNLIDYLFKKKIERRFIEGLDKRLISSYFITDLPYLILKQISKNNTIINLGIRIRSFLIQILTIFHLLISDYDCVISWESNSYYLFKFLKKNKKIKKILYFGHIYLYKEIEILKKDKALNPKFANSYFIYRNNNILKKIKREVYLSDLIFTSSTFGKKSLTDFGVDDSKIITIPLGFDNKYFSIQKDYDFFNEKVIKILFVGGVGQRKGIQTLFKSLQEIDKSKYVLELVGPLKIRKKLIDSYNINYNVYGKINNRKLIEKFKSSHIFILPSIIEGFGIVLLEAMASNMVVITTTNTGGPDIIKNESDGFIIKPYDTKKLTSIILELLNNRNFMKEISTSAKNKSNNFTWEVFHQKLNNTIMQLK